jgi:Xaa-Pro aminopeptidase
MLRVKGSEGPIMFLWTSGPMHHAQHLTWTEGRTLQRGDIINTEFTPRYNGYLSQFNWPIIVGRNKKYEDIFEAAKESYFAGLKALKPGITREELWQVFNKPVVEHGYIWNVPNTILAAPHFHGMGLGWDHLPSPIKPNTIVIFEPGAATQDAKDGVHIGDPVLVTENGCRRLGRHPIELVSV